MTIFLSLTSNSEKIFPSESTIFILPVFLIGTDEKVSSISASVGTWTEFFVGEKSVIVRSRLSSEILYDWEKSGNDKYSQFDILSVSPFGFLI